MSDIQKHKHYGDANLNIRIAHRYNETEPKFDWASAEKEGISKQERTKRRSYNTRINNMCLNYNLSTIFDLLKCVEQRQGKLCSPMSYRESDYSLDKKNDVINFSKVCLQVVKSKLAEYGFQLGDIDKGAINLISNNGFEEVMGVSSDAKPTWTKKPIQYDEPKESEELEIDYSKRGFVVSDFKIAKHFYIKSDLILNNQPAEFQFEFHISLPEPLKALITYNNNLDELHELEKSLSSAINSEQVSFLNREGDDVIEASITYEGEQGIKNMLNTSVLDAFVVAVNKALPQIQEQAKDKFNSKIETRRLAFQEKFCFKL